MTSFKRMGVLGAISAVLLLGCGGSGDGGGGGGGDGSARAGNAEAKAYPGKYLAAICSSIVRCTSLITQSDCEMQFKSLYDGAFKDALAAEEKGTARFDASVAQACIAGASNLTCDSVEMATMQNLSEETMMLLAARCNQVFQAQ
jgi:hypothetical protein